MVSLALLNWVSIRRASLSVRSACSASAFSRAAACASSSESAAFRSARPTTKGCLPCASRRVASASALACSASSWRLRLTSSSRILTRVPTHCTLAAALSCLAFSRSTRAGWLSSSWSSILISVLRASKPVSSAQRLASDVAGPSSAGGGSLSWVATSSCCALASVRRCRISAGRPASSSSRFPKSARLASTAARSAFSFCSSCSIWRRGVDGSTSRLSSASGLSVFVHLLAQRLHLGGRGLRRPPEVLRRLSVRACCLQVAERLAVELDQFGLGLLLDAAGGLDLFNLGLQDLLGDSARRRDRDRRVLAENRLQQEHQQQRCA